MKKVQTKPDHAPGQVSGWASKSPNLILQAQAQAWPEAQKYACSQAQAQPKRKPKAQKPETNVVFLVPHM